MDILIQILPYVATAIVTLIGSVAITRRQKAEVKGSEWDVWEKQLNHAAEKLKEANERNSAIMKKWDELSKLHEASVLDSAEKAEFIANQKGQISELKKKNEVYKTENEELKKVISELRTEIVKGKKAREVLEDRVKALEDSMCEKMECLERRKKK